MNQSPQESARSAARLNAQLKRAAQRLANCKHEKTVTRTEADSENWNGAVIEGLTEVRCASGCHKLLEVRS